MSDIAITVLKPHSSVADMLSEILIETVVHGGSVSFMHPLSHVDARAFWDGALASAARDERVIFGAWNGEALVGTVSLLLNCPPNQPQRAEIAKMMTRVRHRGRGIARALLQAAEKEAQARGRTLLVLDTAVEDGASGLYEKMGYSLTGVIPDYALKPYGGLSGTMVYWKRIG